MKIWHIGDTHTFHELLEIPENMDMVIFSGDCSNPKDPYQNESEVRTFIDWFSALPIQYKIFVAGNHDTSIEKGLVTLTNFIASNIIYLENDYVEIEGLKIFGSPLTPTFGNWAFMKSRDKIDKSWQLVEDDIDILITHGPPKGVLDYSYNRDGVLERCGCNSLKKHVLNRIKPKLMCFGHVHTCKDLINAGILQLAGIDTIFSNGSVVTDGKFGKLSSNGNIIEL